MGQWWPAWGHGTHTLRAINLQKSVTQLFIYDITAVLSLRRQKKKIDMRNQRKHWQTRAHMHFSAPNMAYLRSQGQVDLTQTLRRTGQEGAQRGVRCVAILVRCWPCVCDPGAAHRRLCSQLIVCSTNTLEATRVTFIDEGLQFKYPLKHQSVNSLWDKDDHLTGWPGVTWQRPFIDIGPARINCVLWSWPSLGNAWHVTQGKEGGER